MRWKTLLPSQAVPMQMAAPVETHTPATGTVAPPTETLTLERLEQLEAKLDSQLRRWDKPTVAHKP